ncbi:SHSP domain-containing protein [Aphelenchoides besseyi]|nr:SHSP domain-containing protein [Aphelenchoides besseyi]
MLISSSFRFNCKHSINNMSAVPITHDDAKLLDWPLQHNDGVVKVHSTSDRWEIGLDSSFFRSK